jgi:hypothetical protein
VTLRLPEDQSCVDAWHAALLKDEARVVEAVQTVRNTLHRERLEMLPDVGVALRPLFLSKTTIDGIVGALVTQMGALRDDLLRVIDETGSLPPDVRVRPGLFTRLDVKGALRDRGFLTALRPDVFLYDDAALMSEPNMGNGYLVSAAYPDVVDRVLRALPCAAALSSTMRDMPRPLEGIIDMIARRLKPHDDAEPPFVALLMHHEEHEIILSWPTRVIRLIEYFSRQLLARGIRSAVVHEDELVVDGEGRAATRDGARVALVFQIPIGTHFLFDPERFDDELAHLAGTHVGDAPFLMPLTHLAIDKGTMPRIGALEGWPVVLDDGTEVRAIDTLYADEMDAPTLRLEKDAFIVKRSFEGKDTHIGKGTPARRWNRVLDAILGDDAPARDDYVVQPYVPLPETDMPILRDGRIEIVPVSVELSLFILDGEHAGTFARYAPTTDGVVLSPPPDDMGFTLVSLV